jgi:hypothetical protein
MTVYYGRAVPTRQAMRWLEPNTNLPPALLAVSAACQGLALTMLDQIGDDPELTAGLRKLIEAKDCFVRAALATTPTD